MKKDGQKITRMPITHPSSSAYPKEIGWVTLDATAIGGPVYFTPGPPPVEQNKGDDAKGKGKAAAKGAAAKGAAAYHAAAAAAA